MSTLTTNILRLQMQGICYQYQITTQREILPEDMSQLQTNIEENYPLSICQYPYIINTTQLPFSHYEIAFSRGVTFQFEVVLIQSNKKLKFLKQICSKLLRSLKFLHSPQIKASFNAFQEYQNYEGENIIPGLSFQPAFHENWTGISLIPLNMVITEPKDISNAKLLLDYSCGVFYERINIVRVDKAKNQIHFRNGKIIDMKNLKAIQLKNMVGYELARKVHNALSRVKDQSQEMLFKWGINFQSKFLQINNSFIPVGSIILRNKAERNLNDLVVAMGQNAYNHFYRNMFKEVCFEDNLQKDIYFFAPYKLHKIGEMLKGEFENLIQIMNLKVRCFFFTFDSLENYQEINKKLQGYIKFKANMHTFIIPSELTKPEKDTINEIKQSFIHQGMFFHMIPTNEEKHSNELDIIALRHLSILYTKCLVNPWKIKSIPFCEKPTVVCNLNVQQRSDNKFSVCIISSVNLYFSKFCCFHALAKENELEQRIFITLRQSLDKFYSHHKCYPFRVFVFRTGYNSSFSDEYFATRHRLTNYYNEIKNVKMNTLTYIRLNKLHPLRTYKQIDTNFMDINTVKKTQLLSTIEFNAKLYIQLQFDEPMTEVEVIEKENDPSFMGRVLELIVKLCYGSVGNQFGKGRGFFDFGSKCNEYKDFDLTGWRNLLSEGYLMFL